jgi:hypothetical protein
VNTADQRAGPRPTLSELERGRPYQPDAQATDFDADKLAVLNELRKAGARGVTTLEFIRRGIGGLRPPNRIHDLRDDGHVIATVRERGRQFRFVLQRENPSPTPKSPTRKNGGWCDQRATGLPLFDTAVRS